MKLTKAPCATLSVSIMSGLLLVLAASCSFQEKGPNPAANRQTQEAPVVEKIEPVSQLEPDPEINPFTANQFCFACHADFDGEEFATRHQKAGIGCERCHGESERHRSDEANITPPELMYPRTRINPTCMMCHPRQRIEHVKMHDVILAGAETIFDEQQPEGQKVVCTDCHAKKHKMETRTIRWDKATGKILQD